MTTLVKEHQQKGLEEYNVFPETLHFESNKDFGEALGKHFIAIANSYTSKKQCFFVGLAHGTSPSYAYEYILAHYTEIENPEYIWYTFTNSRLARQRNLDEILDSYSFARALLKKQWTTRDKILGADFTREDLPLFVKNYNETVSRFLAENNKKSYDFVFIACSPNGEVAGIKKKSIAFGSQEIMCVVPSTKSEDEITVTPHFLLQATHIAYIATKAEKRRSLAWLFSRWISRKESPGFLRFAQNIENFKVYIDNQALTWPQIQLTRKTPYGESRIKLDFSKPFNAKAKKKKPVILMIHGFLGLNSFDALLTHFPTTKYCAVAMHYGSIPQDLPPIEYSMHVVRNIDFVVNYFGELGHPVYILDHSIANIYFLMQDRELQQLKGIKKYLKGRIAVNPFFAEEAKHATLGFIDYVISPSLKFNENPGVKLAVMSSRRLIPFDTRKGVRNKGLRINKWLLSDNEKDNSAIWDSAKTTIINVLTKMDSLPQVDVIPVKRALSRLNSKIFSIQIYSAIKEYESFDKQKGLLHFSESNLPILVLQSKNDAIAKFVERLYLNSNAQIIDVTDPKEKNLFKEHLFHMINPLRTIDMVDEFIEEIENAS